MPVAIGALVLASLGLVTFSWLGGSKKRAPVKRNVKEIVASTTNNILKKSMATDDATLDDDSAAIDAQIKALDGSNSDVGASLNDTPSI